MSAAAAGDGSGGLMIAAGIVATAAATAAGHGSDGLMVAAGTGGTAVVSCMRRNADRKVCISGSVSCLVARISNVVAGCGFRGSGTVGCVFWTSAHLRGRHNSRCCDY